MALRKKKKTLLVQVGGAALAAKPLVGSAVSSAGDFVAHTAIPALHDAREKTGPVLIDVRDRATPLVVDARDRATPLIAEARDKAREVGAPYVAQAIILTKPYLDDVKDRAAPLIHDAAVKAAPIVSAGAAAAGTKAAAIKDFADAKAADLAEEPQQEQKRSKIKTLLVVAGVAGVATLVAKKLQGSQEDPWQSSYTPTPPPAPPTSTSATGTRTTPPVVDDVAGASPDEALADAAGAPRTATTPDDPAEVIDVDGQHKA